MRIMPWLHFKDGVARVRRVVPVRLRPFFNGKTQWNDQQQRSETYTDTGY